MNEMLPLDILWMKYQKLLCFILLTFTADVRSSFNAENIHSYTWPSTRWHQSINSVVHYISSFFYCPLFRSFAPSPFKDEAERFWFLPFSHYSCAFQLLQHSEMLSFLLLNKKLFWIINFLLMPTSFYLCRVRFTFFVFGPELPFCHYRPSLNSLFSAVVCWIIRQLKGLWRAKDIAIYEYSSYYIYDSTIRFSFSWILFVHFEGDLCTSLFFFFFFLFELVKKKCPQEIFEWIYCVRLKLNFG